MQTLCEVSAAQNPKWSSSWSGSVKHSTYNIFSSGLFYKKRQGFPQVLCPHSASPAMKVDLEFALVKNSVSFCRHWTFSPVEKKLFASRDLNRQQILVCLTKVSGVCGITWIVFVLQLSLQHLPLQQLIKKILQQNSLSAFSQDLFSFLIRNSPSKMKETNTWRRDQNTSTPSWNEGNFYKVQEDLKILIF